jgi:hypothetical protein
MHDVNRDLGRRVVHGMLKGVGAFLLCLELNNRR